MMEKQIEYSIDYPVAAEIIIESETEPLASFCLEALKLAVKEHKMPPETAQEYYRAWFGKEFTF